jgi:uncharacterized protein
MHRFRRKPSPRHSIRQTWQRRFRYFYYRFVRMEGSTETLARGLASGVFSGMFPLFGLQTVIGVSIAFLVRGNKLMAAAGTWVSNPLTDIPIFFFNFKVGQWLLSAEGVAIDFAKLRSRQELMTLGADLLLVWLMGCLVVGCTASIASYFLGRWLIQRLRQKSARRVG